MPLYEVKKGFVPQVAFGEKPEEGWLRVGPETERLWSYPTTGKLGSFVTLGIVVDRSHISTHPAHRARMRHQNEYQGEEPVDFQGIIPIDGHSFHDIAVNCLMYRSGLYRGAIELKGVSDPNKIFSELIKFASSHPMTYEDKLSR